MQVADRDVLVCLVGEQGVAGAVVDRGDAQLGELGDVGPAELGTDRRADGLDEGRGRRAGEPGQGAGRRVGDGQTEALEHLLQVRVGVVLAAVGGEPEVDLDHGLIGHHVARDATCDRDRVEALAVLQPVDLDTARLVRRQQVEHRGERVDRVGPAPGTSRVGTLAGGAQLDPHGALAAGLDAGVGGLHQDGEVPGQQLGSLARDPSEPVVDRRDLLGVVEHVGDVAHGVGGGRGQRQGHRHPALHVAGPQAPQDVVLQACGQVPVDRHGVEVSGDHDPLVTAQVGAGHDRVAVADDVQVRQGQQGRLDVVGEGLLVQALGRRVHEGGGQRDDVGGEVERHALIPPRHPRTPGRTPRAGDGARRSTGASADRAARREARAARPAATAARSCAACRPSVGRTPP